MQVSGFKGGFVNSSKLNKNLGIALGFVLVVFVGWVSYLHAKDMYKQEALVEIDEVAETLAIELDKFRVVPQLISEHPLLINAISKNTSTYTLNTLLEDFNHKIGSEVTYFINEHGKAIASSNWNSQSSFVGNDYGFRPYFQQSIKGESSSHFALGTVSGKRGYYFSHPVKQDDKVIGVLVVKVSLKVIDDGLSLMPIEVLITDHNGVVFFSSIEEWSYKSLISLDEKVKEGLIEQKKFGDSQLDAITRHSSIERLLSSENVVILKGRSPVSFVMGSRSMETVDWHLIGLVPITTIQSFSVKAMVISLFIYALLFLAFYSWRRAYIAKNQVVRMNETLELQVKQRTTELSSTNEQLSETLKKYKKTESDLKQTESELIQAAKLAMLGEMSAGINHELNQPLTAMNIYLENSKKLLEKDNIQSVSENLDQLLKLNHMLSKIVGQYKIFSKKAQGNLEAVDLSLVLESSINILNSKINQSNIQISINESNDNILVWAERIPLEQVMINIINNAIHAIEHCQNPKITIHIIRLDQQVKVHIKDNGKGFSEENLVQVFEPFFTTKGTGLGLGLTISSRIIELFGGNITAGNNEKDGACVTILLRQYGEVL